LKDDENWAEKSVSFELKKLVFSFLPSFKPMIKGRGLLTLAFLY